MPRWVILEFALRPWIEVPPCHTDHEWANRARGVLVHTKQVSYRRRDGYGIAFSLASHLSRVCMYTKREMAAGRENRHADFKISSPTPAPTPSGQYCRTRPWRASSGAASLRTNSVQQASLEPNRLRILKILDDWSHLRG